MAPAGTARKTPLGIIGLLLLATGCLVVLWPFISALLWASVICFSTWPVYCRIERAAGGHRPLAAAITTLLVTALLVAPFAVVVIALSENISSLIANIDFILQEGPPSPPTWIVNLPVIGGSLAAYLEGLAYNAPAFILELQKLTGPVARLAATGGAIVGSGLLELLLSVFITFFVYRHGRQITLIVRQSAFQVAEERAESLLNIVGATVNGVLFGLLGTALAQALLAGIGFWIASVPQSLLLGFVTFILSFVPGGPPLVWGSVSIWFLVQGNFWWGIFLAAWGLLLVSSIDNVLRPYVMARSNSLPILLGLFGFLGGIMAFGLIGIFLGPTLLAVGYTLLIEWHATSIKRATST